MDPTTKTFDGKPINAILLPTATPQFRFRKPRRMIQFSTDPRLDCYELAGPLSRFSYEDYLVLEEPVPDDSDEEDPQSVEGLKNAAAGQIPMPTPTNLKSHAESNLLSSLSSYQPKQLFNFCSATSKDGSELPVPPSVPTSPRKAQKSIVCGPMRCSATFEREDGRATDENRCRNCSNCSNCAHKPIETTKFKNNYTLQKKRIFWDSWVEAREKTGIVPKVGFEATFRTYKYEDREAWQRIVNDIFK